MFYKCENLSTIVLPQMGNFVIEQYAFAECGELDKLELTATQI